MSSTTSEVSAFASVSGKWKARKTSPGGDSFGDLDGGLDGAVAAGDWDDLAVGDAEPGRVGRVELKTFVGHEGEVVGAPGHRARVVVDESAAGDEHERVVAVGLLARRQVGAGGEAGLPVCGGEAVEVECPRSGLVWRAAGPVDRALAVEPLVGDAAELGRDAGELVHRCVGRRAAEVAAERRCNSVDDLEVGAGVAGRRRAGRTRWKRRSKLTKVPSFSKNGAAGSTTCAHSAVRERKRSCEITSSQASSAASTRFVSGSVWAMSSPITQSAFSRRRAWR